MRSSFFKTKWFIIVMCLAGLFMSTVSASGAIELRVGDTYNISLSHVPRYLKGVQWTTSRPDCVTILTKQTSATTTITIKAVKAFTGSPCIIQCKYYYLELDPTTGRYTYERTGFEDWYVNVSAIQPTSIELSETNVVLTELYHTARINATLYPSNATSGIKWKSSNSSVASISLFDDYRASITAVGYGEATITVTTDNNKSASCRIYVQKEDVPAISVKIVPSVVSVAEGESKKLSYSLTPAESTSLVSYWKSENTSIAEISSLGLLKGIKAGQTTVSIVLDNGVSGYANVTVTPSAQSIELQDMSVTKGYAKIVNSVVLPLGATADLAWSSSDKSVATVDSEGRVKGLSLGKTTITATSKNGAEGSCEITVVLPEKGEEVDLTRTKITKADAFIEAVKKAISGKK